MSRVLLFTQAGSERPKCIRSYREEPLFNDALDHDGPWWLVECENADAGREIIEATALAECASALGWRGGRILASGGKT